MNDQLRAELIARKDRDQDACARVDAGRFRDEAANAALDAITQDNAARLRHLLATHGWPGWRLVGVDGAHAAWLIVQHADHDLPLQKQGLAALEAAVRAGDADPQELAYLVDRVAVAEKRKQVYGTQF